MTTYGERIAELRKMHGITQKEIAELLGVSVRAAQNYEYMEREPSIAQLQKLADYFNVSIDYLVGRMEAQKDNELHHESPLSERLLEGIPNLEEFLPAEKASFFRWIDENVEGEFYYEFDKSPEESRLQFLKDLLYLWGRDSNIKNPKKNS